MKIFITGGAGYIGSHTVLELSRYGHQVLSFDNLSNSNSESLRRVENITGQRNQLIVGDIRDTKHLTKTLENFAPDAVIHFAALKSVFDSLSSPVEYYDVNVNGTLSLLKSMYEVECYNILFSSSATVYGIPRYLPLDEEHVVSPVNPYGRSKLVVENILKDWVLCNEINKAVCLRYFNPVGADKTGMLGESANGTPNNLLPYVTKVATGQLPYLKIYGDDYPTRDGTGERDYIHITDLAVCHKQAILKINNLQRFQILNVGTGKGTTVKELISAFEKVTGLSIPKVIESRREGDVPSSWANTQLAEFKLDYKCERNIFTACRDAWLWQKQNPNGFN